MPAGIGTRNMSLKLKGFTRIGQPQHIWIWIFATTAFTILLNETCIEASLYKQCYACETRAIPLFFHAISPKPKHQEPFVNYFFFEIVHIMLSCLTFIQGIFWTAGPILTALDVLEGHDTGLWFYPGRNIEFQKKVYSLWILKRFTEPKCVFSTKKQ